MTTTEQDHAAVRFVGAEPWLPWPLSVWRWWTEPVAAERLAALRIGLALFLLLDIFWTYVPNLEVFFGDSGPSGPRVFGWYTQAPRWTWSVLRGIGDPLNATLILVGWLATTVGIVFDWFGRGAGGQTRLGVRWRLGWLLLGLAVVAGGWARASSDTTYRMSWRLFPSVVGGAAVVAFAVELLLGLVRKASRSALIFAAAAGIIQGLLLATGLWLSNHDGPLPGFTRYLRPWQGDADLLYAATIGWAVVTALLAIGWQTRVAAAATWIMSTSFSNLNPNIDNAGDVIRGIVLFYLMLCPCGAVWSVDRLWQRWRSPAGNPGDVRIVISPWALRLLFIQLILIYFMNGIYKLGGESWWKGESLHYVLCDVTLTRFSYAQLALPLWLTQLATWTVLAWEVVFPLLVSLRWTRTVALLFGVMFHLGIYATMELGNFVPYALMLYVPLLPWESIIRRLPFRAR